MAKTTEDMDAEKAKKEINLMALNNAHASLHKFNFIHEIKLASTSEALHVNNVEFFQYFDDARMAYLDAVGCPGYDKNRQFGHIVLSNHCDYHLTLNAPDNLLVGVKALGMGRHTIKLGICIVSTAKHNIVADGYTVAIVFDFAKNTKVVIPADIVKKINALEGFE